MAGMKTLSVLAGDLNGDGIYDICLNTVIRSGTSREYKPSTPPMRILMHEPAKDMEHSVAIAFFSHRKIGYVKDLRKEKKDVILKLNNNKNCIDLYTKNIDVNNTKINPSFLNHKQFHHGVSIFIFKDIPVLFHTPSLFDDFTRDV